MNPRRWRWVRDPVVMEQVHFWLALFWFAPAGLVAVYIVFWMHDPWAALAILLVSNYANFVSHWGAWQAVRAELEAKKVEDIETGNQPAKGSRPSA